MIMIMMQEKMEMMMTKMEELEVQDVQIFTNLLDNIMEKVISSVVLTYIYNLYCQKYSLSFSFTIYSLFRNSMLFLCTIMLIRLSVSP